MGTPAPPNEPGSVCNLCFGSSGIFQGNTPKFLDLTVSGVLPGQTFNGLIGGLPNKKYRLQQIAACAWRFRGFDQIASLLWSPTRTVVTVQDASTLFPFQTNFVTGVCMREVPNTWQVWNGNSGYEGKAVISWQEEGLN